MLFPKSKLGDAPATFGLPEERPASWLVPQNGPGSHSYFIFITHLCSLANRSCEVYNTNYGIITDDGIVPLICSTGIMAVVNNPRNPEDRDPHNHLFGTRNVIERTESRAIDLTLKSAETVYRDNLRKFA
ncbi:hypothetical protein COV16_02400 [Candidatus Woesearchaeota archaeon CG10_big_fil_rev_8_21_14_0_10_34_8]|nr:MAG: hypothetical protein COV16_02400 [Candidatus Woesearchaeota archaeon CG10_big_fil_rev_8_21_14_0_10_34_8]